MGVYVENAHFQWRMIDMYEQREDSPTTDNGTPMKYFPNYIFIENKPNWGTKHYWMNEWNEWCEKTMNPTDEEKEWIDKIVNNYVSLVRI